jgi:hypothetical protein
MLRLCLAFLCLITQARASDWTRLEFLLGSWTADDGKFSFERKLGDHVIVRTNSSPQLNHEDLMTIYVDEQSGKPRAIYFDSEGHVIRYNVEVPSEGRAVFESDGTQQGPKYRLTYQKDGKALTGTFEIAPPGSEYKQYLKWTSISKP